MKTFITSGKAAIALATAVLFNSLALPAVAAPAIPENLGGGLRELLETQYDEPAAMAETVKQSRVIALDEKGRVLVEVHASGKVPLAQLRAALKAMDAEAVAEVANYRNGVISAWLPLGRAIELARHPGVASVMLSPKPQTNVGATTSQGAAVIKSDLVNAAGITGVGITVGVMSDSYNRSSATIKAPNDVASGDLPNLTNSNPSSPGVKFLIESPSNGTDEGRGMAQIVHDVAPGADLCFATANSTPQAFANNIRSLRTNAACRADVIVDDIIYLNEPMFSDGVIAQAVDEVVTSTTLPGKRVVYFSSAGNRGVGYSSEFRFVADATARGAIDAADTTVNLATIPANVDTSGGFQDFDPGAGTDISQDVTCSGDACTVVFQWDDPFDVNNGVTTNFNFLVFDSSGNYSSKLSLRDNNFQTQQPLELSSKDLKADTSYRIVIARASGGSQLATRLKYVFFGGDLIAQYTGTPGSNASTYGHNSAANANGTAAYVYDDVPVANPPFNAFTPSLEGFSSAGPVIIAFNAAGQRLGTYEVRNQPTVAAPDGVNTTFFPPGAIAQTDYEGDGFPNFFGTSAAAPHAAGVAALLLAKAGGPESLTAAAVRTAMQNTAPARDVDPGFALAVSPDGRLVVSGNGSLSADPNFFHINLDGAGPALSALTLDVAPAGLQFDPRSAANGGYPLTVGDRSGPKLNSPAPTAPSSTLNLTFKKFNAGGFLNFGIDRDVAALSAYGNSADLLASGTFTATFSNGSSQTGTFGNQFGTGYQFADGFGLVDAQAAAASVP